MPQLLKTLTVSSNFRPMKDFILNQVYKVSSIIEDAVDFGAPIHNLNAKTKKILKQKAITFQKETLLHYFIKQEFINYYEHLFTRMAENIPDEVMEMLLLENQFSEYNIQINFLEIKYDVNNNTLTTSRQINKWYNKNKSKFVTLSEKICDDVFFILFSNRRLLHKFNETLSRDFKEFNFSKDQLTSKGRLKRKPFPQWLKKAIYHRDKGRCSFCTTDLTQVINLETQDNYDHIIPLDLFGVNDPTNIQLVCKKCNLSKRNKNSEVGTKYQQWFS